jgi:hypothetical protein
MSEGRQETPLSRDELIDNRLGAIERLLKQHAWLALAIMGAGWVGAGVSLALVAEPGLEWIGLILASLGFVLGIIGYWQVQSLKKN